VISNFYSARIQAELQRIDYWSLGHRCDKRLQRLQKIFVNAFIILSTFISIKIT